MSKHNSNRSLLRRNSLPLDRLKELLDETPPVEPNPERVIPNRPDLSPQIVPETITPDGGNGQHPEREPCPEAGQVAGPGKAGWEDYLDAIRRDERFGFSYDQMGIVPIPVRLPSNGNGREEPVKPSQGSRLSAPLKVGEESFGSIELEGSPERPWTDQEAGLVNNVAQQIALHLENLRLLTQAEQFKQEAEQAVRRMTREGWENYIAQHGETETNPIQGYVYDQTRVLPLEVISPPNAISNNSHRGGPESSPSNSAVFPTIQDTALIKVREETIGELVVENATDEATSNDLLGAVAERLSTHIESLRLLEETERARQQLDRRAAELETVARVSTAAATILEPQTLLQSVVNLTKESFKLYGVHIYLMEEHAGRLTLAAMASKASGAMPSGKLTLRIDRGETAVTRAAQERSSVILHDIRSLPNYEHYPLLPDTLSELAVPMIVGDQVIGVFGVLSEVPNRFSEDDMRTYSTLASQVAIALRNAELYAEQMATVERLRELDYLKSAFLANMSHELRTPLNSILGFTQVIIEEIDGPLTEDMRNDLSLIEKNGDHLLLLINDVLDMAKIEAGRVNLNFETFDLRELLQDVLETAGPLARDQSVYLKLMVNPLESLQITADRFRMRQILLNLVGNSVKFTESGGITILAEQREKTILVNIHDTGIGIPPDKLEAVFEAFSQVDTSTTRKVRGTGLGLPISRRLVEMHGGRLWAESNGKPGDGSTFFLELPIDARPTGSE